MPDFPDCGIFVIGIYLGDHKTEIANDYLRPFVTEALHLHTVGFKFNNSVVCVTIDAFICDAPARAFITCIESHIKCERNVY